MIVLSILLTLACWLVYHNKACFQLNTFVFNNSVDICLDLMLQKELMSGISSVRIDQKAYNELIVTFKSGVILQGWNHNRYYAWLSQGYLDDYRWTSARPSAETMVKLRDAIKDYYLTK